MTSAIRHDRRDGCVMAATGRLRVDPKSAVARAVRAPLARNGVGLVVLSVWRGRLDTIAGGSGNRLPAFSSLRGGDAFGLAVILHYSTVISKLADQNVVLAQRLALLEQRALREQDRRPSATRPAAPAGRGDPQEWARAAAVPRRVGRRREVPAAAGGRTRRRNREGQVAALLVKRSRRTRPSQQPSASVASAGERRATATMPASRKPFQHALAPEVLAQSGQVYLERVEREGVESGRAPSPDDGEDDQRQPGERCCDAGDA